MADDGGATGSVAEWMDAVDNRDSAFRSVLREGSCDTLNPSSSLSLLAGLVEGRPFGPPATIERD